MTLVADWKLADPQEALRLVSDDPIGSRNIDSKPVDIALEPNLSFGGDDAANLSINSRGTFSVAIINDADDPDEDGIVSAGTAKTPEGALPAQLAFDPAVAYLKFRAEAGVKAAADVPLSSLLNLHAEAEASAIFADYRVEQPARQARQAFLLALATPARFATRLQNVLDLEPGAALAFGFAGTMKADVTISWADLFTGQIGSLANLLGTASPIVLSVGAGASLTFSVGASDDFLIVFSRIDADRWRIGVRKAKSTRFGGLIEAGVDVGFADPTQLHALASALLDETFGAPLAQVKDALTVTSPDALSDSQRKIVSGLTERLGLESEMTTIDALRDGVSAIEERATKIVRQAATARVAVSFAYEYNRVPVETNLLQAIVDAAALKSLHADLIRGSVVSTTAALRDRKPGIELELYLNQKEITRSRSFGFTLGFGKWASFGGKDFKTITAIRRKDIANRIQESYLGARSYSGSWVGEKVEWGVDLKAEMKAFSAEPRVSDFSFGIHLLWTMEQKKLSGGELDDWIDAAVVWRVLRESEVVEMRARLAPLLTRHATARVQVTCSNGVLRTLLPSLSAAPLQNFASSLATAMPRMNVSEARRSAGERRKLYAPLWSLYLDEPNHTQAEFAAAAEQHVLNEGRQELRLTERTPSGSNPFSFAGLTRLNGDTRAACQAFTRGCSILQTSILSGARNQKTVDKAFGEMDDLWQQSHHVRAIGDYLLEAAERAGILAQVTRTIVVESDGIDSIVITG